MATLLNVTTQRPNGEKVTKALSNVNPAATDNQVQNMVASLNSLSKNTLNNIEKVSKSNIELPQA